MKENRIRLCPSAMTGAENPDLIPFEETHIPSSFFYEFLYTVFTEFLENRTSQRAKKHFTYSCIVRVIRIGGISP